jgi:hypothetical protein
MSRIAYLDESQRSGFYALAAIAIPHGQVAAARQAVRSIAVPGGRRRRHFVKEEDRDRKQMLATFRQLPGTTTVCVSTTHSSIVDCRAKLLGVLVRHLVSGGLDRLVLDHVDDGLRKRDKQVLWNVLGRHSAIAFSHEVAHTVEPMLWIPDAVAWCAGRDDWRSELDGWVTIVEP